MSATSPSGSLVPRDDELACGIRSQGSQRPPGPLPPLRRFVSKPRPRVAPPGCAVAPDGSESRRLRLPAASLLLPGMGPPPGLCCVGQGQGQGPSSGPFHRACVCMRACARVCARVDECESPRAGSRRTRDGVQPAARVSSRSRGHRTALPSRLSRKAASGGACPGPHAHLPSPAPGSLAGSGPQTEGLGTP